MSDASLSVLVFNFVLIFSHVAQDCWTEVSYGDVNAIKTMIDQIMLLINEKGKFAG